MEKDQEYDDKEMKDVDEKKKKEKGFESIQHMGPVDEPIAEAGNTEIRLLCILPFSIMGRCCSIPSATCSG